MQWVPPYARQRIGQYTVLSPPQTATYEKLLSPLTGPYGSHIVPNMKTREQEIDEKAAEFDERHPHVRGLFIRFSFEIIDRGFVNYSAQAIFERIRWETDEADVDGKSMFKLNNNYRAYYARRFMETYPEYEGFFRTRHRVSGDRRALGLPELTPRDFPYTNNSSEVFGA